MRTGKFLFLGGDVVKILHISPSLNEMLVMNYDKSEKQIVDLHASKLIAEPAYKIGDVAKIFGKNPDTIRKWELRGWIEPQRQWKISPKKSIRLYSHKDIEAIRDVVAYIHVGRPRKDNRITNSIPDAGNLKRYLRERMRNFNV